MSERSYEEDRAHEKAIMPRVKDLVAEVFFPDRVDNATEYLDQRCATDLVLVSPTGTPQHLAVRVRNYSPYFLRYPDDITLRVRRGSGAKTEYEKICDGFGDLCFYGFQHEGDVPKWRILDLDQLRALLPLALFVDRDNRDGLSTLRAFNLTQWVGLATLIVADSAWPLHENRTQIAARATRRRSRRT